MNPIRGLSVLELMVAFGVMAVLAALLIIPAYAKYTRARQVDDAAVVLAQDVSYLERFAQDSEPFEGATIEVESNAPLSYTCYAGRPSSLDAQSHIRGVLFTRSFPSVALMPGALGHGSPLMFAHNGSVQYVAGGAWAPQHVPVTIQLQSLVDSGRVAAVGVDPFTGGVAIGAIPTPAP